MRRRPNTISRTLLGVAALTGWLATLAAGMALLSLSAASAQGVPLAEPMRWLEPLRGEGVAALTFSIVRLVGLALGAWLVISTVASLIWRVTGWRWLGAVVRSATLPAVSRLIAAALGASISVSSASSASLTARSAPVTNHADVVTVAPDWYGGAPAGSSSGGGNPGGQLSAGGTSPPGAPELVLRPLQAEVATWTVRPGDSLWSIAQARVATSGATGADEVEVATYWVRLIAANRDRLVQPSNPDLIFAGQVLVLPPG